MEYGVFDGVGSTFHAIRPGHGIRVDATADTMGRFVEATRGTGILQGESGARPAMPAPTIAMWVMVLLLWRLTRAGWTNSRQEAALTGPDAGSGAGRVRGRCRSRYPKRCGCR